jgi:hypothetical protein
VSAASADDVSGEELSVKELSSEGLSIGGVSGDWAWVDGAIAQIKRITATLSPNQTAARVHRPAHCLVFLDW